MIVYTEPCLTHGISVCFVPDIVAIEAVQQTCHKKGLLAPSDAVALEDFKSVHFGETIEQTIEKMAKAMYMNTYNVTAAKWKDAAQESWRHKARAALRALGVVLP